MRDIKIKNIFISFFSILTLSSCAVNIEENQISKAEQKPLVLTTFTVLADMARNVAGDRLIVKSITKVGSEIHGYQPTPSDLVKASGADLVIKNGLGLELWAEKFIASAGDLPYVDLSEGIKPLLIEGDNYNGRPNPHVWMSPLRALAYVDRMVEAFIKLDPGGADDYLQKAKEYKDKIRDLDIYLRKSLASIPEAKRVLVSCEGALSYLAQDYGMKEAYLWPVNAESQVTPRRMLRLIRTVKSKEVPAVFCESTVSPKAQIEVAKASGASFGGVFFVDSLSDPNGPAPTFLELLKHNVYLIQKALSPEFAEGQ